MLPLQASVARPIVLETAKVSGPSMMRHVYAMVQYRRPVTWCKVSLAAQGPAANNLSAATALVVWDALKALLALVLVMKIVAPIGHDVRASLSYLVINECDVRRGMRT
jgi:hypothetical protein